MDARITVIADDFTGACEIAGAALRHRIRSVVTTEAASAPVSAEILQIVDSETRLTSPSQAAKTLGIIGRGLAKEANATVFKKTDSVFRGPVRAELEALAETLGLRRIVLVPSNPGKGRTIHRGLYTIDGVPLHETVFAQDPHHPARSSDVSELLGTKGKFPLHSAATALETLPETGLIVGDASTQEDLAAWARKIPPNTLIAGSAAFFEHWLIRQGVRSQKVNPTPGFPSPGLLISGTTVAGQRAWLRAVRGAFALSSDRLAHLDEWAHRVVNRLGEGRSAVVFFDGPIQSEKSAASKISAALAHVAALAVNVGATRHLVIEGGATSAAVVEQLGWKRFEAVYEWGPGLVLLRPESAQPCYLTVKPGSYPWPEAIASPFSNYTAASLSA